MERIHCQQDEVIDLVDSTSAVSLAEGKDSVSSKATPGRVESFFVTDTPTKGLPLRYEDDDDGVEEILELTRRSESKDSSANVEDPLVIKQRLMQLVIKGQQEAEMEEEQRKIRSKLNARNVIHMAKDDAEMYDKKFL